MEGALEITLTGKIISFGEDDVSLYFQDRRDYLLISRKLLEVVPCLDYLVTVKVVMAIEKGYTRMLYASKVLSIQEPNVLSQSEETRFSEVTSKVRDSSQQAQLREALLKIYGNCVLSSCSIEPLLEAAHIYPVSEGGHCSTDNAILLRADLHKLFDTGLITIDAHSLTVRMSSSIQQSIEYSFLQNRKISLLISDALKLNLAWHNQNVFDSTK